MYKVKVPRFLLSLSREKKNPSCSSFPSTSKSPIFKIIYPDCFPWFISCLYPLSLFLRISRVSLKGNISSLPEQPYRLYISIALYSSTHHSCAGITQLRTGWAQDDWIQRWYHNWYFHFDFCRLRKSWYIHVKKHFWSGHPEYCLGETQNSSLEIPWYRGKLCVEPKGVTRGS